MLEQLDNYDWAEVFKYTTSPGWTPPGSTGCQDGFGREAVSEILAMADGNNDGPDWVGVFRLHDGRFACVRAGCDYTGWGCQEGGSSNVAATMDDIVMFGLGDEERHRLQNQLPDYLVSLHLIKLEAER